MTKTSKSILVLSIILLVTGLSLGISYWRDLSSQNAVAEELSRLRFDSEPVPLLSTPESGDRPYIEQFDGPSDWTTVPIPGTTIEIQSNPSYKFLEMNNDFAGWIKIDGTRIDYPFVRGPDNDYYLDHGFDKKKNSAGSIFMDYRNIGSGEDQHTIIYGHNMRNQSMFAELKKYLDPDFFSTNREFEIDYLFGTKKYRVFSAYVTKAEDNLVQTQFDQDSFDDFILMATNNSVHPVDTEITFEDQLLTLATCAYNYQDARLVIHAILFE